MYKETVTTISQLTFSTLATTLTTWQSAIESNPTQRVDPHQASTRVTSSDNQDESTRKDKKDKKDEDCTSAKVAARPQRIQCWICKQSGHGINQCNALVTIPENSSLAKSK
ncbi:hypothetical protein NDA11_002815 [Ustilago hordei]|uniref:Uncharacterized protein n=1 Tax=Ustilago hordei TaxID=120017 RepID=I2FMG2_USTHO|nr:uncharacterized protein UHO2_00188 [Ustilago hordei]KAJ1044360.1 hypothetical protein NDA10_004596 [Ustilago hordei]KAJ1570698.1 hypothetical protein NDA11_002815 [Ustilago hordei]KAJ1586939.1 hypothetical protein NDA15_000189 [Ustilago hordei]KAJ1589874.1 hypothetical protein NDA12_001790 [Ustilago hordei]UTT96863.1 hypothetical protein NDA17_004036 [Ustilago hordei]